MIFLAIILNEEFWIIIIIIFKNQNQMHYFGKILQFSFSLSIYGDLIVHLVWVSQNSAFDFVQKKISAFDLITREVHVFYIPDLISQTSDPKE